LQHRRGGGVSIKSAGGLQGKIRKFEKILLLLPQGLSSKNIDEIGLFFASVARVAPTVAVMETAIGGLCLRALIL